MSVVRVITLVSSLILTVSCGGSGDGGGGGSVSEIGGGGDVITPALDGEFSLAIFDEIDENFREFMQVNMQPRLDYVNRVAEIPNDIPVTVLNCGVENAFYLFELDDVEEGQLNGPAIFMCWELYYDMLTAFGETFPDNADLAFAFSMGAYAHVLHHEMGHAFDDQLDLAIVGNTESAADAIAAVLSIEQDLAIFVIAAALLFDASGDGSFGAVHPGGADRAGDLFCWAVGGDEETAELFPDLVQIFIDSGRDCVTEYAGQRSAVVSWLPGIDDVALASNPDRSILSSDAMTAGSLDGLRAAVRNSPTIKGLIAGQ